MKTFVLTEAEIKEQIELKLENACEYLENQNGEFAFWNYVEAMHYFDFLFEMGVEFDDDCIINARVHGMIELLQDNTVFVVKALRGKGCSQ